MKTFINDFKSLDIGTHDHMVISLTSLSRNQSEFLHSQGYQFWLIECPDIGLLSVYGQRSDLEPDYKVLCVGSESAKLAYIS